MLDSALYVTSFHEIFWGVILVAVSLGMHGMGMILTLRVNGLYRHRFEPTPVLGRGMFGVIIASWMILLVHLSEVLVWALFFQWKECFPNLSTAVYFALNEYTTVGSPLDLPSEWRLLEGMIATAGLLGFAWSTGVLLTLASAFQDNQLKLLRARHHQAPPPSQTGPDAG